MGFYWIAIFIKMRAIHWISYTLWVNRCWTAIIICQTLLAVLIASWFAF